MTNKGRQCSVEGCQLPARSRGYCHKHYKQVRRHGRLTPEKEHRHECIIDGCTSHHKARGYCVKHYTQFLRHGKLVNTKINKDRKCYLVDCDRMAHAKGLCNTHHRYYLSNYANNGHTWQDVDQIILDHNQKLLASRNRLAIIKERHELLKQQKQERVRQDALQNVAPGASVAAIPDWDVELEPTDKQLDALEALNENRDLLEDDVLGLLGCEEDFDSKWYD